MARPGRQLYYEDTGRGDAVVLMPGWGGSIADLGRLRRDLADGFASSPSTCPVPAGRSLSRAGQPRQETALRPAPANGLSAQGRLVEHSALAAESSAG